MKNNHLTDEILQAFQLKEIQGDAIVAHLAVCTDCQKRLEEYHHLIDSMQQMKPETFTFDVTALAMETVVLFEQKKRRKQAWAFWGILVLLSVAIASFSIPYLPEVSTLFDSQSFFTTLLVIGTGLAVLFFLGADMIRQYQTKEKKIFKNNLQPIL